MRLSACLITCSSLLCGGWMLADGIHVLRFGKYVGPELPGPWRHAFIWAGIDPLSLGWLFVLFGLLCALALAVWLMRSKSTPLVAIAIATLWYLPVGTMLSLAVIYLMRRPSPA